MDKVLTASKATGLPNYSLSPAQGKFLALHCRTSNVTDALEVDTLGGYSAIWLASENPKLRLTTVEYNSKHVRVARKNIELAELSDQIEVIHGAGIDVLSRLQVEVKAGIRQKFGFVFIDADQENNWYYFRLVKSMAKPNPVICIDNIVREGQLADLSDTDLAVVASRELVDKAGKEPDVDQS